MKPFRPPLSAGNLFGSSRLFSRRTAGLWMAALAGLAGLIGVPAARAQLAPVVEWKRYGDVPGDKLLGTDPVRVMTGLQGDIYVAGTVATGVGRSSMAVWRYDSNGNLSAGFPAIYPSPADDESGTFVAVAMTIGVGGTIDDIYITGHGPGEGAAKNIVTARIDLGGNILWGNSYDRHRLDDVPADIVDGFHDGTIYIAGTSAGPDTSNDIIVLRLDAATGAMVDMVAYDGLGKGDDTAKKIVVQRCTESGENGGGEYDRVYVGGTSYVGTFYPGEPADRGYDYVMLAYSNDLMYNGGGSDPSLPEWVDLYHGGVVGGDDVLTDFVVNQSTVGCQGFVYATGYSERLRPLGGMDNDYATIGYDRLTGARQWAGVLPGGAHRYNGFGDGHDYASGIMYGANAGGVGHVYVTGTSYGGPVAENEIATVAIDVSDGFQTWTARFNREDEFENPLPGDDRGIAIGGVFYDLADGIYVTGRFDNGANADFVTIRYEASNPNPLELQRPTWSIAHDSDSTDVPSALVVVDPMTLDHKHIYVVGMSPPPPNWPGSTNTQQTLIKYIQVLP